VYDPWHEGAPGVEAASGGRTAVSSAGTFVEGAAVAFGRSSRVPPQANKNSAAVERAA
jgi:hypothetical protein